MEIGCGLGGKEFWAFKKNTCKTCAHYYFSMHIYVKIHIYNYLSIYLSIYIYVCMYVYIYIYMYVCMYIYIYIEMRVSWNRGTPKSSIYRWRFPYKRSSYWGIPHFWKSPLVFLTVQALGWLAHPTMSDHVLSDIVTDGVLPFIILGNLHRTRVTPFIYDYHIYPKISQVTCVIFF